MDRSRSRSRFRHCAHGPNATGDKQSMHVPDDLLEQYAMGKLNEEQTAPIEEHLLVCEHCRREVELVDRIRAALGATGGMAQVSAIRSCGTACDNRTR